MKLDELKKLCEAATPEDKWSSTLESTADGRFEYATGPWHDQSKGNTNFAHNDAQLIAAARTMIPKLIAVAEAAMWVHCPVEPEVPDWAFRLSAAVAALESPDA